jgi:hypothetical protein
MSSFDAAMNDADHHYYETDDCFTRHIEAPLRRRTIWHDRKEDGKPARMMVGDERCNFFSVASGDNIGPPGIMKSFLRRESDDVVALSSLIGAESVLAGSDYPHPEGLAEPREFLEEFHGLPDQDVSRIMRGNFEALVL